MAGARGADDSYSAVGDAFHDDKSIEVEDPKRALGSYQDFEYGHDAAGRVNKQGIEGTYERGSSEEGQGLRVVCENPDSEAPLTTR